MFSRKVYIIKFGIIFISAIFIIRLFDIQILNNEFKIAAANNTIHKITEYPYRGEIFDRKLNLLVHNEPVYNIMLVPKALKNLDKKKLCKIFKMSMDDLSKKYKKIKNHPKFKPYIFKQNLSHENFAKIQDHLSDFIGFYIQAKTVRSYPNPTLANSIGYMNEINSQALNLDKDKYYGIGDMVGRNGLEMFYEKYLRGIKGVKYKLIDAIGRDKGSFKKGKFDIPATPGKNIITTISLDLQLYCDKLMKNKKGSIVVLIPKTGEILALASYPSYDPNLIKGEKIKKNYTKLLQNPNHPLFNRATMAMYPPGSIFKIIQGLIALKHNIINPTTKIFCDTSILNCHKHPNPLNFKQAIKYSCNNYFYYYLFKKLLNQKISKNIYEDTKIGYKIWYKDVKEFGLGTKLGIDIPYEKSGYIPSTKLYDSKYGKNKWKASTIRSLGIGQGEMSLTPIQMANLAAIIANRGFYITPHMVKKIGLEQLQFKKHSLSIKQKHFAKVIEGMLEATKATAFRANIKNIDICCKTGTVQNPHGKDHSVFMGFAPKNNPQIAISVYVENSGWGSQAATAIGGLIIEKYLNGKVIRKYMEKYALQSSDKF